MTRRRNFRLLGYAAFRRYSQPWARMQQVIGSEAAPLEPDLRWRVLPGAVASEFYCWAISWPWADYNGFLLAELQEKQRKVATCVD